MASLATGVAATEESGLQQDDSSLSSIGEREFSAQTWKLKAEQAKKAEFLRESEKLKHQIALIEKDRNGLLYNKKNDFRAEYSPLEEYEQKLAANRKAEKIKSEQQLSRIHNNVRRLQLQLKDVKPTPEFVEKLREMMEEVDNAISIFKDQQRIIYEELIKEEKTTSIELTALEKKIEASFVSVPEKSFKAPSSKAPTDILLSSQLPEEVVAYEKFLQQTGGRLGGWDDFDHQSFLKVWTKHKGKPSYLEEALAYLPSRTREDVQQHEAWYQELLCLEEKKKEAIQKWKSRKLQEKLEMAKVQEKTDEQLTDPDKQQKENAQKQKLEEERRKRQQEIESWKRQREIEAAAKLEVQLKEEEERQRKLRKERQRQMEVKLIVEEHARIRKEQEEFLRLEKEMREEAEREEKRQLAALEICRFQDRDQRKLVEKMQEKRVQEEEEREKEKRLAKLKEKVQVHVDRDPSRLCKLTKGWEERCKSTELTTTAPLLQIPHRAIPTWRQGL